jgi:hypothetical protein
MREIIVSVQLQCVSHLIVSKLQGMYLIPLIDLFCVCTFLTSLNNLRAIFNFGLWLICCLEIMHSSEAAHLIQMSESRKESPYKKTCC